jgi:hypothetical protein
MSEIYGFMDTFAQLRGKSNLDLRNPGTKFFIKKEGLFLTLPV